MATALYFRLYYLGDAARRENQHQEQPERG